MHCRHRRRHCCYRHRQWWMWPPSNSIRWNRSTANTIDRLHWYCYCLLFDYYCCCYLMGWYCCWWVWWWRWPPVHLTFAPVWLWWSLHSEWAKCTRRTQLFANNPHTNHHRWCSLSHSVRRNGCHQLVLACCREMYLWWWLCRPSCWKSIALADDARMPAMKIDELPPTRLTTGSLPSPSMLTMKSTVSPSLECYLHLCHCHWPPLNWCCPAQRSLSLGALPFVLHAFCWKSQMRSF